jgi:uncharacterized protein (UPF0276 family)
VTLGRPLLRSASDAVRQLAIGRARTSAVSTFSESPSITAFMGGIALWSEVFDLVGRTPLTAHGIALSIGTDVPLDDAYLDKVAVIVERLKASAYSEHLAFTRVPGRYLGNRLCPTSGCAR